MVVKRLLMGLGVIMESGWFEAEFLFFLFSYYLFTLSFTLCPFLSTSPLPFIEYPCIELLHTDCNP